MRSHPPATPTRRARRLQQLLTLLLVPALVALAGYLGLHHTHAFDWTAGSRNTLTEGSRQLLAGMPGTIRFTAFVSDDAGARRDVRDQLRRYQSAAASVELAFVDPSREPERTRAAGIRALGEVQVEYEGRSEVLRTLDEPTVTLALHRLAEAGGQQLLFLQGHGERGIDDGQPTSLTAFAQALRDRGLMVDSLNLATSPRIPDTATVLVLASPQRRLLDGEQRLIADWLRDGGSLVWLADPDSVADLGPINALLGVTWHRGVAVFEDFQYTTGHPAIFLAAGYPPHPITQRLDDLSIFPLVRSLHWDEDGEWQGQPLLMTAPNSWLEAGPIEGALRFDEAEGDRPGPLVVGATLSRRLADDREQRVVLIGDADFASDMYFGEVGNSRLALAAVQWAAARDARLDISVPAVPDASLYLPGWTLLLLSLLFLLLLPVALLAIGVVRWALRRRR